MIGYPPNAWRDAAASACVPRPRLTVSEWADRYRVIPPGTSPESGPWRTERAPYLRGIMDAMTDPTIETVVVMVGSQLGKSEALLNILGYFVDQDPSPVLMVQPTIESMESFSKERIDPTFRATRALRGKLETGKDDRGNSRKSAQTIRLKQFPGGYLAMAGANAPAGLASRPIRVVLFDELDRFPPTAGTEGDPVKLAVQRTSNFRNRKILMVSTPTIDGVSKIQEWYLLGDQRQYLVPCPHCGVAQVLLWDRLIYKNEAGERDFGQVHYLCAECGQRIEERDKPAMVAAGQWVPQNPGGRIASFGDLSALYSRWTTWEELARQWCTAQDARDRQGLQEFVNLRLGQPWVEHQQVIHVEYLERRREYYGPTLPAGVVLLTAGVDVQDDRLEVEVVGWGAGRQSWGVQYLRLEGDPLQPFVWQLLDSHLAGSWETADGRRLGIVTTAVDSGGHCTAEVYAYCRQREARRVWAIKGKGGPGLPSVSKPTRGNRFGAALFTVAVDEFKGNLLARLLVDNPGPGHCHFPREPERGYEAAYFAGLLSEKRVVIQRAGVKKVEWKKVRDRNEPLDCRVYASAALEILISGNPGMLDEAAARVAQAAQTGAAPRPSAPRGRRILSKGVAI